MRVEVDVVGQRHAARVDLEDLPAAPLVGRVDRPRGGRSGPGRSSAESRISGRLVAAITITPSVPVKPSISVRIWFSVCSRSSWPPSDAPPPRARPIASSSSMKMIAGAAALACANRSRTRLAPTPTIASTNSEAEIEKNGTSASPATARASSVLPVPGRPGEQHALGDRAAERACSGRGCEEVDHLDQLLLGLVDAGDVLERHALAVASARSAWPASARTLPSPPPAPAAAAAGDERRTSPTIRMRRPERRAAAARQNGVAVSIGLGVDHHVLLLEQAEQAVVAERRPLGLEPRRRLPARAAAA